MTKKFIALLCVLGLVFSLVACAADKPGEGKSVVMIADTAGLGDESFNDSAYEGLTKAKDEFGVEVKVLESVTADDYGPNITAATEEKPELIIAVGYLLKTDIETAAKKFTDQKYAIIDDVVDSPNVVSVTFREQEGSFLVGVMAGLKTETNVIGFVGGMEFPLIQKFEYGFKAGVKSVNPDAKVIVNYTGSFEKPELGKEVALTQNQAGADVIFHASGGCGIGVIQAAGEKNFWAIGVDKDQSSIDPEHVLCSMIKRVDTATYMVTKTIVDDKFVAGSTELGLKEEGIGYSDKAGNLTKDLTDMADKYKAAIVAGDFEVPFDKATFDVFEGFTLK
ncbi:MAG: BMP family ABC transporter substrate-binding protein [Eubacteriaceae bacterium]|nr:BMP family ABC transporter substrate-binding protein [Eubacteriaceae bacterium]